MTNSGGGDIRNISIDIHSNQLLDWLIDRRHCNRNYQLQLNNVKQELTQALKTVPQEAKEGLENCQSLCYYHIRDLFTRLGETESKETNIFGSYTSPVLKSLYSVLKSFEKNNLFLAESAMVLVRLQVYEIPFYRKSIAKLKSSHADLEKKINDLNKRSEDAMARYLSNCKKYGVCGVNLIQELLELTTGLGDFLNGIGDKCGELKGAISIYELYLSKREKNKNEGESRLGLLKYVVENGNTTVAAYETGTCKETRSSSGNGTSEYELVNNNDYPSLLTAFDFVKSTSIDSTSNNDNQVSETQINDINSAIDWGIDDVTSESTNNLVNDNEIDFGITCMPTEDNDNSGFTIEVVGDSEKVGFNNSRVSNPTCNKSTTSIFEYQDTRLNFLSDIEELRCFLAVRCLELEHSNDNELFSQSKESLSDVKRFLEVAADVINSLTNQKTRDLLLMLNDTSHIEKIAEGLSSRKKLSLQLKAKAESLKEASNETLEEEKRLRPIKAKLESDSLFIKTNIETSISQLYKGRPVTIILNQ